MRIINKRSAALLVLILLLSVGFIYRKDVLLIARHSVNTWNASDRISLALEGAKSVVLVEFDDTGDTIRVPAGAKETAEIRRATNRWLLPSGPEGSLCFDPHHRVEVVRTDGSHFSFIICFECRNFELDPPQTGIIGLPDPWRKSLTALFKSAGMKPFNSDEL
jgi:hypothetical protein